MIELLKKLWEWIRTHLFGKKTPLPDPPPLELPFYIEEMRDGHPGMPDEELAETVWLTALEDTTFFEPHVLKNGEIYRNDDGFMVLRPMRNQKIGQGKQVQVYRWAFRVDGGSVRESVWQPEAGKKGLASVKKFSKPEG